MSRAAADGRGVAVRLVGPHRWRDSFELMELAEARRFAMSLPGTEEPHFDRSSFRIRGKIFATVPVDAAHLHAFVTEAETRASVAEDPSAFEELWWGKTIERRPRHLGLRQLGPGVRVTLGGMAAIVAQAGQRPISEIVRPDGAIAQADSPETPATNPR